MSDIHIIVQVPPPPYVGEKLPPAPPVDWSLSSSLRFRDEDE